MHLLQLAVQLNLEQSLTDISVPTHVHRSPPPATPRGRCPLPLLPSRLLWAPPPCRRYILQTYARPDIVFTHGEGVRMYDAFGKEYLDFAAGIAVNALGES